MKPPFLFIFSFCLGISIMAQGSLSDNHELVKKVSERDVHYFLNLIPQGQEMEYGFNSRSDFDKVEIGEAYEVYFVKRAQGEVTLMESNTYRVPLLVNGQAVALLSVVSNEKETKVVDFGAVKLARTLQALSKKAGNAEDKVLIRNTYLSKDYLVDDFNALATKNASGELVIIENSLSKLVPVQAGYQSAINTSDFVNQTVNAVVK